MNTDAHPDEPRQRFAEARREPELSDQFGNCVSLLAGRHLRAGQGLRTLERGRLGEVHDVDRGLAGLQQLFNALVDGRCLVVVVQRNRPLNARDDRGVAPGAPAEIVGDRSHVAECRRHENELHLWQRE